MIRGETSPSSPATLTLPIIRRARSSLTCGSQVPLSLPPLSPPASLSNTSAFLTALLLTAGLEAQREDLIKHEGPSSSHLSVLDREVSEAQKISPSRVAKGDAEWVKSQKN
jgi:hypothetical protein